MRTNEKSTTSHTCHGRTSVPIFVLRSIVEGVTDRDIYDSALATVRGSVLPGDRVDQARDAVRRFRSQDDEAGLSEYMQSFALEADAQLESNFGNLLRSFEAAILTDTAYAIAIAKPAGQLAARRREKELRTASPESDSHAPEVSERPRLHACPDDHAHGRLSTCYTRHSCRCDDCRAANSARRKAYLLAQGKTRTSPPKKRSVWTPEPLSHDDPRHGTRNGYLNYKCRCNPCAEANRAYVAERRKNPTETRSKKSEHGTTGRYVRGCRCAQCARAMSEYNAARKST